MLGKQVKASLVVGAQYAIAVEIEEYLVVVVGGYCLLCICRLNRVLELLDLLVLV